jgi:hypothetical protein
MAAAMKRSGRDQGSGVRCPVCRGKRARVIDWDEGPGYIRRRHLCLSPSCLATVSSMRRGKPVMGIRWTSYQFFSPRKGVITVPPDTRVQRHI